MSLAGTFCSAVASYKTSKKIKLSWMYSLANSFFPPVHDIWPLSKGTVFPFRMSVVKSVYFKLGVSCTVNAVWSSQFVQTLGAKHFFSTPWLASFVTVSPHSKMVTPTQFLRLCFLLIVCLIRKWVSIYTENRIPDCGDATFSNCTVLSWSPKDRTFGVCRWEGVLFCCCCLPRGSFFAQQLKQSKMKSGGNKLALQHGFKSQIQSTCLFKPWSLCSFHSFGWGPATCRMSSKVHKCVGKGLCVPKGVFFTSQGQSESNLDKLCGICWVKACVRWDPVERGKRGVWVLGVGTIFQLAVITGRQESTCRPTMGTKELGEFENGARMGWIPAVVVS